MGELLPSGQSKGHFRGTGFMDTPQISVHSLATVEKDLYSGKEPDEV
jgi:hypothetical protein